MQNNDNIYKRGKIYAIRSPHTEKYYIGSTTSPYLSKRLSGHRMKYKLFMRNESHYMTSFELFKLGDEYIELIENCSCDNVNELCKREGELIRQYKDNIFNKFIPDRTQKEYVSLPIQREKHKKHANEKIKCNIDGCDILFARAYKSIHNKKFHN